jgi:hypothetical protein
MMKGTMSGNKDERKVLDTFLRDGRLTAIPAKQKKRAVILRFLAERFEPDRMYDERKVNDILAEHHEDVASLGRYLVDTGLLRRQIVRSVQAEALFRGNPEVTYQIMYWKPGAMGEPDL